MATCKRTGLGMLMVLFVLAAGVVLLAIPSVGEVTLGSHAVEKHWDQAVEARQWISKHGGPFNRYDCPDGRTRVIVPMNGNRWAVMVVESGIEVTSFITEDQGYVKGMIDPCKQWMNFAHP